MRARVLGLVAALVAPSAHAQVFGPPVNVSNTPTPSVSSQDLFVDFAGHGAVTWEEITGADPNQHDVLVAVSVGNQVKFAPAVNVSNHATLAPAPRVVIDQNLGIDVVWSSDESGGRKIHLAVSRDGGLTYQKRAITGDFAFDPDIGASVGRIIYVAWAQDSDNDGRTDEIFVSRSDDGVTFTTPVNVSRTAGHSSRPRILVFGVRVYVAFTDDTPGAEGVYVARSEDAAQTFGTPVRVPGSSNRSRAVEMTGTCCSFLWLVWSEGNDAIMLAQSTNMGDSFQTDLPLLPQPGQQVFGPDVAFDRNLKVHIVFGFGTVDDRAVVHTVWEGFGTLTFGTLLTNNVGFHGGPSIAVSGANNVDVSWLEDVGANREVFLTHPPFPNLKLLFVPIGDWSSDSDFEHAASSQIEKLTRDLPVDACASTVEATVIQPSAHTLHSFTCSDFPLQCSFDIIRDFAQATAHVDVKKFDIVVGLLPDGGSPCGKIVGCSNQVNTVWLEATGCPVLAHEVGHIFALVDEYQSQPAGCTDPRCNDGGAAFGGNDINFLGADENCDPRANMGCCDSCPKSYPKICCKGNQDVRGGRSTMSFCGASSDQTWEARSVAHLSRRAEFQCQLVGTEDTLLSIGLDLPRAGGATLTELEYGVGRPTISNDIVLSGDTEIRVRYLDGATIFTDRFDATYAYNGPMRQGLDYTGIQADVIERLLRIPVNFDVADPRPTTIDVIRQGQTVFRGTAFGAPPVADAGPDQTVECTGSGGATVVLDGTGSSDADGDLISFAWTGPFGTAAGATPSVFIPLGTHVARLVVSDGVFGSTPDTTSATVQDTLPPTLAVTLDRTTLWPPNHELVRVQASVSAEDACGDAPLDIVLSSITSNQPDDGLGDGDTTGDIQDAAIGTLDTSFLLRAERSGNDARGRTYTITYTARDASGNATSTSATVLVPHNR